MQVQIHLKICQHLGRQLEVIYLFFNVKTLHNAQLVILITYIKALNHFCFEIFTKTFISRSPHMRFLKIKGKSAQFCNVFRGHATVFYK